LSPDSKKTTETASYQQNVFMWGNWSALFKSFWHVIMLHM